MKTGSDFLPSYHLLRNLKGSLEAVDYFLTNKSVNLKLSQSVKGSAHFVAKANGQIRSSVTAFSLLFVLALFDFFSKYFFCAQHSALHSFGWMKRECRKEREFQMKDIFYFGGRKKKTL